MRVRYSNEIAEWKWPPIFQNQEGEICKKEQTSWTSTVVVLLYVLLYLQVKRIGGG